MLENDKRIKMLCKESSDKRIRPEDGSIEGKMVFSYIEKKWKSLSKGVMMFFFIGVFFLSTRVNASDPWPDHLTRLMTGSGFKTIGFSQKCSIRERERENSL